MLTKFRRNFAILRRILPKYRYDVTTGKCLPVFFRTGTQNTGNEKEKPIAPVYPKGYTGIPVRASQIPVKTDQSGRRIADFLPQIHRVGFLAAHRNGVAMHHRRLQRLFADREVDLPIFDLVVQTDGDQIRRHDQQARQGILCRVARDHASCEPIHGVYIIL